MYSIRNVNGKFVHRNKYPLVLLLAVWGVIRRYGILRTLAVAYIAITVCYILIDAYMPKPLVYTAQAEEQVGRVVMIEEYIDWTPERINEEIETQAKKHGVSATLMKKLVQCESMGSTTIQSYHQLSYGREESYGLAQIHLRAHKDVTKEQALDPKFALDFMAKNIAKGKANMWACYKMK